MRRVPEPTAETRKLAAIMFNDMVGYSALMQRNERLALEFPSALAATRCAIAIQRALVERNRAQPEARRFQIRVGLHLGDVVHRDGDVLGDGVNIAARVEPLAEPGGICLTRAVHDQVRGRIEESLESLGRARTGRTGRTARRHPSRRLGLARLQAGQSGPPSRPAVGSRHGRGMPARCDRNHPVGRPGVCAPGPAGRLHAAPGNGRG